MSYAVFNSEITNDPAAGLPQGAVASGIIEK